MNKKWSPDRTFRFIKTYRSHVCLWDISKSIYKDRDMRDAAYNSLSHEFDMSVHDVKTKIKNLRATYFQEVKKINESMRVAYRSEDVYRPNLVWFSAMESFIKSIPNGKIEVMSSEVMNESSIEDFVIKEEPLPDFPMDSELISTNSLHPSSPIPFDNNSNNNNNNRDHQKPKRRKMNEGGACNNFQILPSFHHVEDEFDIFGKHVACQLRQLSICRALEVQAKIQCLLSKERAKDIRENSGNDTIITDRSHNSPTSSSLGDLEQSTTSSSFDLMGTF